MGIFGFSTKAFEQFVQATAILVLGPGVKIYGSGPDGGRECAFNCEVPYPTEHERWNGYGVIQAKCKEKTEGTKKDQEWALELLESELKKFQNSVPGREYNHIVPTFLETVEKQGKKRTRLPEYFIFATNVVLTSASGSGGKDRAEEIFKKYSKVLPLEGWDVWDSDQLNAFVDAHSQLRRRFTHFLTPSDILDQVISQLEECKEDYEALTHSFLERELRSDQDSRLDQAGVRTEDRTSLARVFIELYAKPESENNHTQVDSNGLLDELLKTGNLSLDPQSLDESRSADMPDDKLVSRFVMVGGPGSGKSTLGQFLAQIHRAAWLDNVDAALLEPETKAAVSDIKHECMNLGFSWPKSIRIPFRVELRHFAKSLAVDESGIKSLSDYLLYKFCHSDPPHVRQFTRWLFRLPLLLILDGLDEVPSSSNRTDVCDAIRVFFAEASRSKANLLVQATTRPEGYNDEFGGQSFHFRYLAPLKVDQALKYASRLAHVRFGTDSLRISQMLKTLEVAASHTLTAKLMETPLQVTFLATLVAAGGTPPRDRWRLFHDYYDTIYKREQQKCDDSFRGVLDERADLIHSLHHEVGYLLHLEGEKAGGTDAEMDIKEFERLVVKRLVSDEFEQAEQNSLRLRIVESVTTRLVFLTSRVKDKVSFDVRSLQEFMACERLTSCPEPQLPGRLAAIAKSSYWRNVFLFIAGKYYSKPNSDHLRLLFFSACEDLNDKHECASSATVRLGSQVAIDLIEDGTVARTPRWARKFVSLALQLLDLPELPIDRFSRQYDESNWRTRLTGIYKDEYRYIFTEAIESRLRELPLKQQPRSWQLLLDLVSRDVQWAQSLADERWPSDPISQLDILTVTIDGNQSNRWIQQRLEETIPKVSPTNMERFSSIDHLSQNGEPVDMQPWLRASLSVAHANSLCMSRLLFEDDGSPTGISLEVPHYSEEPSWTELHDLVEMPSPHRHWQVLFHASVFAKDTQASVLASVLHDLGSLFEEESFPEGLSRISIPWPLQCCLAAVVNGATFERLATDAANGVFGDHNDWKKAEKRWSESGVTSADVTSRGVYPLGIDLSRGGFGIPWIITRGISVESERDAPRCSAYLETLMSDATGPTANCLARLYLFNLMAHSTSESQKSPDLTLEMVKRALNNVLHNYSLDFILAMNWNCDLDDGWMSLLNDIGNSALKLYMLRDSHFPDNLVTSITNAYETNPNRHGLLRILAFLASKGCIVNIDAKHLDHNKYNSTGPKLAALCLRVPHYFDSEEIEELVEQTLLIHKKSPNLDVIDSVVRCVPSNANVCPLAEQLYVKIYQQLPQDAVQNKSLICQLISRVVDGKSSGLDDETLAIELDLPTLDA